MTKNKNQLIQEYSNILREIGIDLKDEGINDYAISIKDANLIINFSSKNKIPIAGGDVMEKIGDRMLYDYSGWSTSKDQLVAQDYFLKSLENSIDFVEMINKKKPNCYIVFVVDFENMLK